MAKQTKRRNAPGGKWEATSGHAHTAVTRSCVACFKGSSSETICAERRTRVGHLSTGHADKSME
jgi:hypothetical protein